MAHGENRRPTESPLVRFAREYGWRAYAIPVLAVLTVFMLVDVFFFGATEGDPDAAGPDATTSESATTEGTGTDEGQRTAEESASRGPGPDPAEAETPALAPTELPPGGDFAESGEQTYRVVGTPGSTAGEGTEETFRYVVEVEDGVDTTAYGGDEAFARFVDATLADPRGWTNDPRFRFEHVAPDQDPNLRLQLTSVDTTAEMCGTSLAMDMETSCRTTLGGGNTVVLNDARWSRGADPFEGDLGSYRQYLVNHEVGHAIGYASHVPCGGDGELAPIMMQQTLSMNNSELASFSNEDVYPDDGATCRYNPWPYPQPGGEIIEDGA